MPDNRKLANWIDAFLKYTENSEPPEMFRKWTAISVIASALQRKCRVEWGSDLVWYPNLYIVLVGPSATGKGTAMNPGLHMLQDLGGIRMAAQATSRQALIRKLKESNDNTPELETGKMQLHSSLTVFSKEFTVFLGYHNRELMSDLCDWYDCDNNWAYETIARKREEIIGVWVNLIGGTTPELIRSSMPLDAIGGGLTSRIIYIYQEKPEKIVYFPQQTKAELELYHYLINDLHKIHLMSGSFRYTKGFMDAWQLWCDECRDDPPFYDHKFDGYMGRRRAHTMKVAMVIAAAKGREDMCMIADDLELAIKYLKEAEVNMPLVFKGIGRSETADILHDVMTFLKSSSTDEVPMWQFAQHFQNDMDSITMNRVLDTLAAMKLAVQIKRPQHDTVIKILDRENMNGTNFK